MKKGFLYLTAIMDVFSRKILSRGISNTLDAQWYVDVFNDAVDRYGASEIINSGQGSQYTSLIRHNATWKHEVKISMDGKVRAIDNICLERLWKTIKYNSLSFHPTETGLELYNNVDYFVKFYNNKKHLTTDLKPMLLIILFVPKILLLNTTNIN